MENFLECYHCAVAHPGFADVIDVDEDAYRLERHPTFASHFARVRERPASRATTPRAASKASSTSCGRR